MTKNWAVQTPIYMTVHTIRLRCGSDGTDADIQEDGISHINKSGVLTKNWTEYLFYRNSSVLADHQRFGVPLSRLDRSDLAHEFAREVEHARIRTRLGDPDQVCQAAVVDGALGVAVIVCRSFIRPW